MAKVMTVAEALESFKPSDGKGRFSKKNFNNLMIALANDENFVFKTANVKGGELTGMDEIMVSKEFRKFCKRLVEKCGVDKEESEKIMTPDFTIENVDGLYEFFATALYLYMDNGSSFDMLPTDDFKASLNIISVDEETKVKDAYSPKDRTYLGKYKTTSKKHKKLVAKSPCPAFLKYREKVEQ